MVSLLKFLLSLVATTLRSRASLQAEIVLLRNQLAVYKKNTPRPGIESADRLLWAIVSRVWAGWNGSVHRAAAHRRELAKETLSRLLGNSERGQKSWRPKNIGRIASTNTAHVESKSDLRIASHCRRDSETWDKGTCGQRHR